MKPWVIAASLFLVVSFATLPSCKKGDASTETGPTITFVDFEEEARKKRDAYLNFDHAEQIAGFVEKDGGVGNWKLQGDGIQGDQAWLESTGSSSIARADLMAGFGVKAVYQNTLANPAYAGETIDITVARMNTLMAAFGVYSAERDPAFDFGTKGLGNQGFVDENTLHVWHSRWIVQATMNGSSRSESEITDELNELGKTISDRMEEIQRPILPRHLRVFPGTDIIANSQQYPVEPFLDIEGMPRALTSEFVNADGILTGFFMDFEDDAEATAHFQLLIDHFKSTDNMLDEFLGLGTESFRANVPDQDKGVFILHRNYIGGYLGFQDSGLPTNLLQAFVENLDSLFPDDTAHLRDPQDETQ